MPHGAAESGRFQNERDPAARRSTSAAFAGPITGSTQCHDCAAATIENGAGRPRQSSKPDSCTTTSGKRARNTSAIPGLGSAAVTRSPRATKPSVALPVPAPDLEHGVARRTPCDLDDRIEELGRIRRPGALIRVGNLAEHESLFARHQTTVHMTFV